MRISSLLAMACVLISGCAATPARPSRQPAKAETQWQTATTFLSPKQTCTEGDILAEGLATVESVSADAPEAERPSGFSKAHPAGGRGALPACRIVLRCKPGVSGKYEYRVRWFDAAGVDLRKGESDWTPLLCGPDGRCSLSAVSPVRAAVSFCVDLRELRPSTEK